MDGFTRASLPFYDEVEPVNREAWLTELANAIERDIFENVVVPAYRISCGWPSRRAVGHKRRLGECHSVMASKANVYEIFISPVLDNPITIAGVICHEMTHIVAGIWDGHGKHFRRICRYIGLDRGKPCSRMPGVELQSRLEQLVEEVESQVGSYPHRALACV